MKNVLRLYTVAYVIEHRRFGLFSTCECFPVPIDPPVDFNPPITFGVNLTPSNV